MAFYSLNETFDCKYALVLNQLFNYSSEMTRTEELYKFYLRNNNIVTDSRRAKEGGLFFALKGDRFDGNDFALKALEDGADYAIIDREELKDCKGCFFVDDVLKSLQNLANHHRRNLSIPVLGITGTNGKTTTKELIASVLKKKFHVLATSGNFNNHIGVPLTLLSITQEHEFAIIEMGANHPGEIDFLCKIAEPDYGIITNVGKAHLEGFGSFEGVKQTKSELYRFIASEGKGVFLNLDNSDLVSLMPKQVPVLSYAVGDEKADLYGSLLNNEVFVQVKVLFDQGWLYLKSKLTGAYNLENILAACRIGVQFGVDPILIQQGIEEYVPANNRSQIYTKNNTTVLVDCYNANPSSMAVSIRNFVNIDKPNKLMILGDMLELGAYSKDEHQHIVDELEAQSTDIILVGKEFVATRSIDSMMKFESIDALIESVSGSFFQDKFILLKGSRGIRLEKLLDYI